MKFKIQESVSEKVALEITLENSKLKTLLNNQNNKLTFFIDLDRSNIALYSVRSDIHSRLNDLFISTPNYQLSFLFESMQKIKISSKVFNTNLNETIICSPESHTFKIDDEYSPSHKFIDKLYSQVKHTKESI